MNQTTEITAENVCDFLKKFATDISIEDLKPIWRNPSLTNFSVAVSLKMVYIKLEHFRVMAVWVHQTTIISRVAVSATSFSIERGFCQ